MSFTKHPSSSIQWLQLGSWFYSPFDQLLPDDVTRAAAEYRDDPYILDKGVWAAAAVATRNETFIVHEKQGTQLVDKRIKESLIVERKIDLGCWERRERERGRDYN